MIFTVVQQQLDKQTKALLKSNSFFPIFSGKEYVLINLYRNLIATFKIKELKNIFG